MKAIIDMDIVLYSVGFYHDEMYYTIGGVGKYKYKKEAVAKADADKVDHSLIFKHHEANKLEKSLGGVDWLMSEILRRTEVDEHIGFLSGDTNFREEVAVTAPYKGNRDDAAKPFWFAEMKEYLIEKWGGEVTDGIEADDAIGIAACAAEEDSTIICSLDKDLKMIPGQHFNWRKGGGKAFVRVGEVEAWKNFYSQLLTGDSTDNIIGVRGIGDKTASKLLARCSTPKEMLEVVKREYKKAFKEKWEERMVENGSLLYIQRKPNDKWDYREVL